MPQRLFGAFPAGPRACRTKPAFLACPVRHLRGGVLAIPRPFGVFAHIARRIPAAVAHVVLHWIGQRSFWAFSAGPRARWAQTGIVAVAANFGVVLRSLLLEGIDGKARHAFLRTAQLASHEEVGLANVNPQTRRSALQTRCSPQRLRFSQITHRLSVVCADWMLYVAEVTDYCFATRSLSRSVCRRHVGRGLRTALWSTIKAGTPRAFLQEL